jgi:predicted dehydrogenase
MLDGEQLDGIVNLTPAPLHADLTRAALRRGVHVYSEKPLAYSAQTAAALIREARGSGCLLLCAPASMAASCMRWIKGILADDRIGTPTLAVAQLATLGPAAWRMYTGDARGFYSDRVGPVLDLGVYALHCITGLLGPVRRLHAMASIGMRERVILAGVGARESFRLEAPDHVMLQLALASGAQAQVLASFAVPATRAPFLEIHCTRGTLSLREPFEANARVDAWLYDDRRVPLEGWLTHANQGFGRTPVEDLIACGIVHFVACLTGAEEPITTAAHALHVLEIAEAARTSIAEGGPAEVASTIDGSYSGEASAVS